MVIQKSSTPVSSLMALALMTLTTVTAAATMWVYSKQQHQRRRRRIVSDSDTTNDNIQEEEKQEREEEEEEKTVPTSNSHKQHQHTTPSSSDGITGINNEDDDDDTTTNTTTTTTKRHIPVMEIETNPLTQINTEKRIQSKNTITIAYASTTGTCESFAKLLHSTLEKQNPSSSSSSIQLCQVNEIDWWDELLNHDDDEEEDDDESESKQHEQHSKMHAPIVIFILPTWTDGTLPPKYVNLTESLSEISNDWRIPTKPLRQDTLTAKNNKSNNKSNSTTKNSSLQSLLTTKTLHIASFGMGSSAYGNTKTFCKPSKDTFATCMKLGARSFLGSSQGTTVVGMGDDDIGDCRQVFEVWMGRILVCMRDVWGYSSDVNGTIGTIGAFGVSAGVSTGGSAVTSSSTCCGSKPDNGTCCQGSDDACTSQSLQEEKCQDPIQEEDPNEVDDNDDDGSDEDSYDDYDDYSEDEEEEKYQEPEVMDLEDIGNAMAQQSKQNKLKGKQPVKEMVTPKQAIALKKEGYKIIGTHSAVKLCRWTKHQLRGRGGCYKHTFYGITSYQCMEATPSLACANKCVFCWRHHKNPVGKEWRWKVDDPNEIVDQAVKTHVSMIKEAKGIPGVKQDRWKEAHTVRHCALSLVGEPIMYPRIDEFLADLHSRLISTFLVTNGQHPQAIESLRPITQLYVSVDASTPETLIDIDRPLFKDAWDRLKRSLMSLKKKGQRTVARLTVVKGWNSDEVEGYAKLIALGHCSLVEMKGVTFCGKSDASNLNMSNSPWHHEVVSLAQKLKEELSKLRENGANSNADDLVPEYDIACEHKHSCSVLLARVDKFSVTDPATGERKWKTWIDYDKFQELAKRNAEDPSFTFDVEDYVEDTPKWALFGSEEEGFDPTDTRHHRKKKHPKYTKFDVSGIPTHDDNAKPIDEKERNRLRALMDKKKREIGDGVSVFEYKGGEKKIEDASLMFRGLVVTK